MADDKISAEERAQYESQVVEIKHRHRSEDLEKHMKTKQE